MKLVPALLLNVAVVAAGLFVYDRWVATQEPADPFAAESLDRLESQMKALGARKVAQRDPRMERVAEILETMSAGLDAATSGRVLAAIQRSFADREKVVRDPALPAWSEQEFARRFRAAIEPHINEVRVVVPDPATAEAIVKRFIYDGRPIVKPDLSKGEAERSSK